jgi:transcriptional regulator with XRE-family HTH domain
MTLRELREQRNLTQGQVAERGGMRQAQISLIERERKANLRLATIDKLARGLGCTPDEVIAALRAA